MAKRIRKNIDNCVKEMNVINGKVYLKFRNTKKCENAQDIIDKIKTRKIIIK